MNKTILTRHFSIVIFAILMLGIWVTVSVAQNLPLLYITKIDTSHFPDVKVWAYGDNLGMPLDSFQFVLKEDDVEQNIITQQTKPVGVQVAFVIDDYASGDASLLTKSVKRLAMSGQLSSATDWFAIYELADEGIVEERKTWTQDIKAISGLLGGYRQSDVQIENTNLFDTVSYIIDQFSTVGLPETMQKSIVLFSSGQGTQSSKSIDDVIEMATQNHVRLYTILIGQSTSLGVKNLRRLANLTNGQYFAPTTVAELDALWNDLALQRNQLMLEYRSSQPRPDQIKIIAYAGETRIESSSKRFPLLAMDPAQIVIPQLVTDTLIIKRHAQSYNTPISEMEPISVTIPIAYYWTDGYTRTVTKLEYIFDGLPYVAKETDKIVLPIANVSNSDTLLQIIATDELGINNTSNPIPVQVISIRPPRPVWRMVLGGAIVLLMALLLGWSGYFWWQKRSAQREKQITKARLEFVSDTLSRANHLPRVVELHQGVTRLGRDMTWANVIIDHPRISGKHCSITEETDGVFRIRDENSRNGTFVNQNKEKLEARGYILKDGDEIRLATIVYRFSVIVGTKQSKKSEIDPLFFTEDTNALFTN